MNENPSKSEKTKYRLADSIKDCMNTKPVDKITVQNIVDGCLMTRQTFYRNFKDKYDLINWYFDKLVMESFAQIGVEKTVGQSLKKKYEFIKKEKILFPIILLSINIRHNLCLFLTIIRFFRFGKKIQLFQMDL